MKKYPERKHRLSFDQNIGFNKKYTTIALYTILVLVFGVICVYFLINNDKYASFFSTLEGIVFPIFTGMVLAYILNPILKLFEEKVFISSAQRRVNKLRRKLFNAKLTCDHICRESDEQSNAPESAQKALEAVKAELADAKAALQAEKEKRTAAQLEKASKKKKKPSYHREPTAENNHPFRGVSLLCTYLVFVAIMTLLLWIVIPQCIDSVAGLIVRLRGMVYTLPSDLESLIAHNELAQTIYRYISEYIANDVDIKAKLMEIVTSLFSTLSGYLSGVVTTLPAYIMSAFSSITNIILALFFSVYFLSSKEMLGRQAHKVGKAFLPSKLYKGTCHVICEIDRKFGKFIEGKILDSTIIGILALIVLWFFKMPYYQMLALIIGITNIIPFFGPIIGGVIGGAIILISDPSKLIAFIIIVLVIQQLDGNVIGPLILGDSLGLQPIWIMIAIVIMSSLFGFFGMLFGVPLFAVIYTLIHEAIEKKLNKADKDVSKADGSDAESPSEE